MAQGPTDAPAKGRSSSALADAASGDVIGEVHKGVDRSRDPSGDPDSSPGARLDALRGRNTDLSRDLPWPAQRGQEQDLEGDLRGDHEGERGGEEDEVWFEADALAAASQVELGDVPSGPDAESGAGPGRAAGLDALRRSVSRRGVSLAELPGWPGSAATGQGLGAGVDALLGTLHPGDLGLITAGRRGAGRTSLLAQLADGLALRGGEGGGRGEGEGQGQTKGDELAAPLTPVLVVSDEAPALWRARSLARWSGRDVRHFTGARAHPEAASTLEDFARGAWAALDARQRFIAPGELAAAQARSELLESLRRWQRQLAAASERAPEQVWPVLILDPLEALAPDLHETLAWLSRVAEDESLVILASADAPASEDMATSRALDRHLSARLHLSGAGELGEGELGEGEGARLELSLRHRRLGPRGRAHLRWDPSCGRFEALALDE
ncbi:hypothetical protein G6O69_29040 [Pseudenhygromyxa sp. WMMC2535]|uniref:hypothetical protein n=1 Tax=Pseudenhygromyxa sp. WMMC2535 TaxID=2712867 RepID=UPI0015957FA3|nr:hypothetical protein [Pseudenhygromyxa sp. WMMC2535]NVB41912.1 hypothetical protein [Pseudenhygromyxa sp. WMMC2535]